ncbi:MAG: hypothetical protein NTW34_08385 [Actinobacteria bacterium]|nr:hypothetical protein [Actinomycetota bacterium]
MITTSSKLFYGLGTLSFVGALVWVVAHDGSSLGSVALIFLAISLLFLGGIASYVRDGHVLSTDTAAHASAPAAQSASGSSWWPLASALALGMVVVGLISSPGIFKIGIALSIAMFGEWMITNWSDSASANAAYNDKVRGWVVHPLEIPIGGALLMTVIVLSFSRIMLSAASESGPIIFAVAGTVVLVGGSLVSVRRGVSKRLVGGACAVALVALTGVGLAMAFSGERQELSDASEYDHYAVHPCGEEAEEYDESASRGVSAKSSIAATVILKDGKLYAEMDGFPEPLTAITLQRSYNLTILFRNESVGEHRMILNYGSVVEDLGGGVTRDSKLQACTALIGEGGQQAVQVRIPKPSFASPLSPYNIVVSGIEDSSIEVSVP